jgi:hypothetical protein
MRPLLIALCCLLAATAVVPGVAAAKTKVRYVWPMNAEGQLKDGWRVSHVYRGSDCWTTGSSPGAWRCMTRNSLIYDPCFEAAPLGNGIDRVFCPLAPWRKTVAELRLPNGYPDVDLYSGYGGSFHGLTLSGGRRCHLALGASDVVDGKRVNYFCPEQRYLIGQPSRRTRTWRIQEIKRGAGDWIKTRKVGVRIAWRYRTP